MRNRRKKQFKTGSKQKYVRYYAIETRQTQLSLSHTITFALLSSLIILFSILFALKPITSLPQVSMPAVSIAAISLPSVSFPQPTFTFPVVSIPKVSLPKPALPEIHLPRFVLPRISFPQIPLPTIPDIELPSIPTPHIPHLVLPEYQLPTITFSFSLPDIFIPFLQLRDNLENLFTSIVDRILAFYIAVWEGYLSFTAQVRSIINNFLFSTITVLWNIVTFLNPYPLVIKLIEIGQVCFKIVWGLLVTVLRFLDPRPLFATIGSKFYYLYVTTDSAFHSCAFYMSPYVKLVESSVKESTLYLLEGANNLHAAAQYIAEHQSQ